MTQTAPESDGPTASHAQPAPAEPEAIFVVGVHRSGTTLMRDILERSEHVAIARENHFLGHLREKEGARYYFRQAGDLADDATIRRIADMIYGGEFRRRSRWRDVSTFWRWLVENVPQDEIVHRLVVEERSERGLMRGFMRAYADARGRPVMGEKTPAHLAYVDTLLEWFPNARVIHMLRDPRAVYVSDLRRRSTRPPHRTSWLLKIPRPLLPPIILVQTVLLWRAAVRRHAAYAARYPDRYRLVRFEDVVRRPDETLGALFDFLRVPMPVDPTEVKVVSRGFRLGEQGLDAAAADRWREHIGPLARRFLGLTLRGPMRRHGYND
ncbi:MAG TPA: sulfotransferase [Candidatus Limnocylindria bacterium]|nr:sulfotransferase [Candidatus Limnocylindria bacterium]